MVEALRALRLVLCNVCVLHVPVAEDVFSLHTDASAGGVGAVLNVIREGVTLPVAFFSRQLKGAEVRYSATELEGLALYASIQYFAHFLYGRHFTIYTDHKALVSMRMSMVLNRRLQGKLQDFDFDVVYRKGVLSGNTDGLSRQVQRNELDAEDGHRFCAGRCGDGDPTGREKREEKEKEH